MPYVHTLVPSSSAAFESSSALVFRLRRTQLQSVPPGSFAIFASLGWISMACGHSEPPLILALPLATCTAASESDITAASILLAYGACMSMLLGSLCRDLTAIKAAAAGFASNILLLLTMRHVLGLCRGFHFSIDAINHSFMVSYMS